MSIAAGTRMGPYEIVSLLGAGGMGEVYRARDSRLHRQVAIKTLPAAFASDANRMGRLEREAQVLAALSHPNIAAIYGLEESDGARALVMELVEGPTLAERIAAGPIPLEETLAIARQIGAALEAAHEKGIIHRDLKPANIKITPEGQVKVLDFGLAKAFEAEAAAAGGDPTNSPTLTLESTRAGMILGTAAYMSPEQARGRPTDKRTDIWAFGVILYEMLTGRMMFDGETVSDTLAGVLRADLDWKALPADTPPALRRLLERCLERDPKHRLRDIGDAWFEIDAPAPAAATAGTSPRPSRLPWIVATAMALAGVAGLGWGVLRTPASRPQPVVRWSYTPSSQVFSIALSKDGSRMAVTQVASAVASLAVRMMDRDEMQPVQGTDGALSPVFSPDGQWIAYLLAPGPLSSDFKLTKIPADGGTPVTLCTVTTGFPFAGLAWTSDDSIIIGGTNLLRVSAAGGKPQTLATPDPSRKISGYLQPSTLPGGRTLLLTIAGAEGSQIASLDLKTHAVKVLANGASPHYAATGHLLYFRSGALFKATFSARRLAVTGPEVPVLEGISGLYDNSGGEYDISQSGMLVYIAGHAFGAGKTVLQFTDRRGTSQALSDPMLWGAGRLSPDGSRVANGIKAGDRQDIWVYDLTRRASTRLTFNGGVHPIWSPDGRWIAYGGDVGGKHGISRVPADASAKPEFLVETAGTAAPHSWSPDGKTLVYSQVGADKKRHLWKFEIGGKASPIHETAFNETDGEISPDGRWLAYQSNESGDQQIYVQPFPSGGAKIRISTHYGSDPRWVRNGKELFYWDFLPGKQLMAVAVSTSPLFRAGLPEALFKMEAGTTWDVAPDGKHFLTEVPAESDTHRRIEGVVNWFDELTHRVPGAR